VLIRAGRADLVGAVTALRETAGGLPHPALEAAALEHASFLENLAEEWDVLTRQVLLVIREPAHGSCPVSARALRAGHICGRWSCPRWTPSGVSVSVVTMVVRSRMRSLCRPEFPGQAASLMPRCDPGGPKS
jgi:hypothetical protein